MFGLGPLAAAVLLLVPGILHLAHGDAIADNPHDLFHDDYFTKGLENVFARRQRPIKKDGSVFLEGPGIAASNGHDVKLWSGGGTFLGPGNGGSSSRQSVVDPNTGKRYIIETRESVENGLLVHKERRIDHSSGTAEESGYTLDLSQPDAKPVSLPTKVGRL